MVQAKNIIIGITGTMTSGKGALKYFLVHRGFKSIRNTSLILAEGLKKRVDMSNRDNWLDLVVELRKKQVMEVLSKESEKNIKENNRYVICPIRHPADIKYLKDKYNALIIFIDSPYKMRYRRTLLKGLGSGLKEGDFKKKDEFEYSPTSKDKKYLPNISKCKKLSDEIIINDKSLNDLNKKLERILRKYKIPAIEDTGAYEDFDM
jgi:dephospho-CoA kinase